MRREHDLPQSSFFPAKTETMMPKDSYKDRVVFITGGGTVLGKGMATKFSELGANVVIASRLVEIDFKIVQSDNVQYSFSIHHFQNFQGFTKSLEYA